MEVILLEKVRNLGNLGDRVKVKPGFGRNFLIPQSKAVFATPANIASFEARRSELEKNEKQAFAKAEQRAAAINDLTIEVKAMASDEGKLYGSVGVNEIKDALTAQSVEISKREIVLPEGPFHSIGNYEVEIHVHSDVIATLKVNIVSDK